MLSSYLSFPLLRMRFGRRTQTTDGGWRHRMVLMSCSRRIRFPLTDTHTHICIFHACLWECDRSGRDRAWLGQAATAATAAKTGCAASSPTRTGSASSCAPWPGCRIDLCTGVGAIWWSGGRGPCYMKLQTLPYHVCCVCRAEDVKPGR